MEDHDGVIFEDHLYKQSGVKHGKASLIKNARWKLKYFILRKSGEQPVLEYYNKKPKSKHAKPKGKISLWPAYRVEKIEGTKNHEFVFKITTTEHQICVSSDDRNKMDMYVFLVQCQARLLEEIQDGLIIVYPENSQVVKRIGGQNTKCILHTSPWGMSLALQATRSIIAQWPIKSIRCYESSGRGQLTIEAGRVAPMGEGVYVFQCQAHEDNQVYDLLDKYVMETLYRVQVTRRGTAQEMEDFHQEFNQLHSLTTVKPCLPTTTVIARTLKDNWNYNVPGVTLHSEQQIAQRNRELLQTLQSVENGTSSKVISGAPALPTPRESDVSNSSRQSPNSKFRTTQPISIQNRSSPLVSHVQMEEPRLTSRPPPPPPRATKTPPSSFSSLPRSSSRQRESSNCESPTEKMTGHSVKTSYSSCMSPRLNWSPPPSFSEVSQFVNQSSSQTNSSLSSVFSKDHDFYLTPVGSTQKDQYLTAVNTEGYGNHVGLPSQNNLVSIQPSESEVSWMASASCEDLSDHMKAVLYDNGSQRKADVDENMNSQKPPVPFPGLQEFRNSTEWDSRDRSRSVDYRNVLTVRDTITDRSPSPSMRRIQKMMAARGESNSLRKSVSNPNFLNIGSLEKLNYEKLHGVFRPSSHRYSSVDDIVSAPLEREGRHKSRSVIDLLSSGLHFRHRSRDKLDPSRNETQNNRTTPSHSRSATPERNARRSRTNSLDKNGHKLLNRQESSKSITVKDPTFKDIRFTERSRSFRKVKSKEGLNLSAEKKECASEKVKRRVFQKQKQNLENQANHFHLQNGADPASRQQFGDGQGVLDSLILGRNHNVVHHRQRSVPEESSREQVALPLGSSQSPRSTVNRAYDPVGVVVSRRESQSSV